MKDLTSNLVDLTVLKAGDTVFFRCGGSSRVLSAEVSADLPSTTYIGFLEDGFGSSRLAWTSDGKVKYKVRSFDIVRVEPLVPDPEHSIRSLAKEYAHRNSFSKEQFEEFLCKFSDAIIKEARKI